MGLFDKKFCDICGEKVNMLVLDGGGYYLYFKMNDGKEINAEIYNEDLVNELRTLAEKCRKS